MIVGLKKDKNMNERDILTIWKLNKALFPGPFRETIKVGKKRGKTPVPSRSTIPAERN